MAKRKELSFEDFTDYVRRTPSNPDLSADQQGHKYADKLYRGAWSDNNPVVAQFPYARSRAELVRLRDEALRWEQDNANKMSDLEIQEALRDEQREYDSYEADIQRQRAAGLNPDLLGAGTSSGSSSGQQLVHPNQMPASQLQNSPSPTEVANTVFNGIGAVTGFVQAFATGVDLFKNIKTMGDQLEFSKISVEAADIAKKQSALQLAESNLDFAGSLASNLQLPEGQTADDETLKAAIADTGYVDTDGSMLGTVKRYMSSPAMQKRYNDRVVAQRQSEARKTKATMDFFNDFEQSQVKIAGFMAKIDELNAGFELMLAERFATRENAEQIADNQTSAIDNSTGALNLEASQIAANAEILQQSRAEFKNYIKGYCEQIMYIKDEILRAEGEYAQLEYSNLPDAEKTALLTSKRAYISQLKSQGCSTLAGVYQLVKNVASDDYLVPLFFETDKKGNVERKKAVVNMTENAFNDIIFNDVLTSGVTLDSLLGSVMNAGVNLLTMGVSGGLNLRGQNINAASQAAARQVMQRQQNIMFYRQTGISPYYTPYMFPMVN